VKAKKQEESLWCWSVTISLPWFKCVWIRSYFIHTNWICRFDIQRFYYLTFSKHWTISVTIWKFCTFLLHNQPEKDANLWNNGCPNCLLDNDCSLKCDVPELSAVSIAYFDYLSKHILGNVRKSHQTTRRHIPEDSNLHKHICENLKSHYLFTFSHIKFLFPSRRLKN
jgi:hypothetical protein